VIEGLRHCLGSVLGFSYFLGSFRSRGVLWRLEALEFPEGPVELTVEGDFVAQEELVAVERVRAGHGSNDLFLWVAALGVFGVLFESLALHFPITDQAPAGGGHSFDEHVLGFGGGLVFLNQLIEQDKKAGLIFALADDAGGEESVADRVRGGFSLSFFGDGALGSASVGSRGFDLS